MASGVSLDEFLELQTTEGMVNTMDGLICSIFHQGEYRAVRYSKAGNPFCIMDSELSAYPIINRDGSLIVDHNQAKPVIYLEHDWYLVENLIDTYYIEATVNDEDPNGKLKRVKKYYEVVINMNTGLFEVDQSSAIILSES